MNRKCSVAGCHLKYRCTGFCAKHYKRHRYERDKPTMAAYKSANKERVKLVALEWRKNNPDKLKKNSARWRKNNPEDRKFRNEKWRRENSDRHRQNALKWAKHNMPRVLSRNAARRTGTLSATPKWANKFFMEEAYDLAKRRTIATGMKWHVDHIVPLKSKIVCGLHCEANLQVIHYRDNLIKGNRFWPDMPVPSHAEFI